ncbi:activating signal cointegrator 1 complex subunit 2 homolog [Leptidea sinapis]|uniref:Uncharacterized protein n=1 Tax=Leptidea sinapis TaxID=189913 RepID=A0A5E4QZ73_9NEOP|nr:activating signal cointegrator 1 complex subunit 2 homolog [Leptidea sinapis]VVD03330.1 unnamed protein product [Leptidea sinapis]
MFVLKSVVIAAVWVCVSSQQPTTTPVPILKQINKQNDDGSYSYGYEAADGSFKIETKYPNGDVAGKYGYVDDTGNLREISYGASSARGFEPEGSGIQVPPPTLNEQPSNALADGQQDDGQYREDPKIYEDPKYNSRAQPRPAFRQFQKAVPQEPQYQQTVQPRQQQRQQTYTQPQVYDSQPELQSFQSQNFQSQPQTSYQFQSPRSNLFSQQNSGFSQSPQQFPQSQVYHQQPQFSYQGYTQQPQQNYQQQSYQQQNYQNQNFNPFSGHPAQNFDPSTGSYSINFTG